MVDHLNKRLNLIVDRCQLQTQALHDPNQHIKIPILRIFPGIQFNILIKNEKSQTGQL